MFNILNTRMGKGKNAPLVCNFLDSLSKIVRSFRALFEASSYLPEQRGLTNLIFPLVGQRIAFSVHRPVARPALKGKG